MTTQIAYYNQTESDDDLLSDSSVETVPNMPDILENSCNEKQNKEINKKLPSKLTRQDATVKPLKK